MIFTAIQRERSGFVSVTPGTGAECKASRSILRRGSRDPPRSAALLFCFFFLVQCCQKLSSKMMSTRCHDCEKSTI